MNFLETNIDALSELSPGLRETLETVAPEELEVVPTHSGHVTIRRRGVYLHSRFDPVKEAEKLVDTTASSSGVGTIVFYGFGLGYHIERFFALHPGARAIVLEPDAAFFRKVLELRDFTDLIRREGLRLLVGTEPEALSLALKEFEDDEIRVFRLRSVYAGAEEYFMKADAVVSRFVNRRDINLATLTRFGRLWVRNLAANLPLIWRTPGIGEIGGNFAGLPSLVIAAGPSLDATLPNLRRLREKFLIVAVDTSYNACLRAGVEPDFVVVVDPQYWNTRHLDRARQTRAVLVSESSTHPRIFRQLPGRRFFCGSLFPLGKFLENPTAPKGTLGAGGSVSTSAWDFARVMGTKPIVMAGLDLGFPNKNTHFKGSFFEERSFSVCRRTSPGETHSVSYLLDAGPRYLPANVGGLTLTDRRMMVYQWWFEGQMTMHPEARTLNLSSRGIKVSGMETVSIEELLAYPDRRSEIDRRLSLLPEELRNPAEAERIQASVKELLDELEQLEGLCGKGRSVLAMAKDVRGPGISGVLELLNGIDESIKDMKHRDVAGFLLASVLADIGAETRDGSAALGNTERVYETLADSAAYHRRLLGEALQKIQGLSSEADESSGEKNRNPAL